MTHLPSPGRFFPPPALRAPRRVLEDGGSRIPPCSAAGAPLVVTVLINPSQMALGFAGRSEGLVSPAPRSCASLLLSRASQCDFSPFLCIVKPWAAAEPRGRGLMCDRPLPNSAAYGRGVMEQFRQNVKDSVFAQPACSDGHGKDAVFPNPAWLWAVELRCLEDASLSPVQGRSLFPAAGTTRSRGRGWLVLLAARPTSAAEHDEILSSSSAEEAAVKTPEPSKSAWDSLAGAAPTFPFANGAAVTHCAVVTAFGCWKLAPGCPSLAGDTTRLCAGTSSPATQHKHRQEHPAPPTRSYSRCP